ncbi:MAG: heavy metal translocating P-type ATPase [Halobacteriovoraceae bacterium]|nr:heavy metal translocating P-type ATPase [Halobacteriovoraceae bacterium]
MGINTTSSSIETKSDLVQESAPFCYHCGESAFSPVIEAGHNFCCRGCRLVFKLLKSRGLSKYYQIKNLYSEGERGAPVSEKKTDFSFLDHENFQKEYVTEIENELQIRFYLEGVHCSACLWLIEKSPEFIVGLNGCRLQLSSSVATLNFDESCSLSSLATEFKKLGYFPHPLKPNEKSESLARKEERDLLIKMGVAMACMGNIGLLSISIYAGADGTIARQFEWLSFLLLLPVILFSAIPFYKNALNSIKRKVISIDLPIVIALVAGTLGGMLNILKGTGVVFFDSMAALVFLLLLSRYVLMKARQGGVQSSRLEFFKSFGSCRRLIPSSGETENILASFLKPLDLILLKTGEMLPVDGLIMKGKVLADTSLLTGESKPSLLEQGQKIYSGSKVLGGEIVVKAEIVGDQTLLGRILEKVNQNILEKPPLLTQVDRLAQFFVTIVLFLAIGVFLFFAFQDNGHEGFLRALSLIIVTCPCALALATPLAFSSLIGKLAGRGIIIRSENVIEKISEAKNIFLDKTGTLTQGEFVVQDWEPKVSREDLASIVLALEEKSFHPIGTALVNYIKENFEYKTINLENWCETPGLGVEGELNGKKYQLKRFQESSIGLFEDELLILTINCQDGLRKDSRKSIEKLISMGLKTFILSGDCQTQVSSAAALLGISGNQIFWNKGPEEKFEIMNEYNASIMVGDGANDALALGQASVGVAVKGSIDISLKAADIYLTNPGVGLITKLIAYSRETVKLIKRNLVLSLTYNAIGAALAIMGLINPLWAAILMPISSLTVLASTIYGTKKMRRFEKGELI